MIHDILGALMWKKGARFASAIRESLPLFRALEICARCEDASKSEWKGKRDPLTQKLPLLDSSPSTWSWSLFLLESSPLDVRFIICPIITDGIDTLWLLFYTDICVVEKREYFSRMTLVLSKLFQWKYSAGDWKIELKKIGIVSLFQLSTYVAS